VETTTPEPRDVFAELAAYKAEVRRLEGELAAALTDKAALRDELAAARILAGTTGLEDATAERLETIEGLVRRVEPRAVEYLRTLGCHNAATILGELAELAKE
jgi:hypothetical protein